MMGTDIQRTILLVFFGFSLFLLWDRWQVYNGKPPMFGPRRRRKTATPPQDRVSSGASTAPAAGRCTRRPSARRQRRTAAAPVDATPGAAKSPPVVVRDRPDPCIDRSVGAVVTQVELLDSRSRPTGLQVG